MVMDWRIKNRSRYWPKALFWSYIKICLVNAWTLYKMSVKDIIQLEFIREVYLYYAKENDKWNVILNFLKN